MPHKPLAASERFYTPDTPEDLYSDVMRELDWSVGQVLDALSRLGLDDRTLVIFTSDNGPWYGGETGGLRGMKGMSWEGGVRVPMIARWPGQNRSGPHALPGSVLDRCDADAPAPRRRADFPAQLDGVDLMPLLSGESSAEPHEAILAQRGEHIAVVRSGKWKLHVRSPGVEWSLPGGRLGLGRPARARRPDDHRPVRAGSAPPVSGLAQRSRSERNDALRPGVRPWRTARRRVAAPASRAEAGGLLRAHESAATAVHAHSADAPRVAADRRRRAAIRPSDQPACRGV